MAGKYTCYKGPDADASTDSTFKNWLIAIFKYFSFVCSLPVCCYFPGQWTNGYGD